MFVGREAELGVLEDLAGSGQAELFVLYGRRRVGKTELLQRFCEGRRAVSFQAAQVRERDNLRAFRDALRETLEDPLLEGIEFPDWSTALSYAADRAGDERLVVVLDEFPYLCEGTKGLPSQLQKFWDTRGKRSSLMLVLCGSQVSFMEREVLAERSPLFGRRTGQRRLEPLPPRDALAFLPSWPVTEAVTAYAVLGGMPAYLRRFRDGEDLEANLLREALRPEGYLFDEVDFLLRSELTTPATYGSLLAAVARKPGRLGEIAADVGIDSTTANKYLSVLRELRLVERDVPVTDPNPLRSRRGVYRIADRFVAFHFRFLQPNLSLIHAGRGQRVFEEAIAPALSDLRRDAEIDFVLDHLKREAADLLGDEIVEAGRHEGEWVRAVARTASGRTVAAVIVPEPASPSAHLQREIANLQQIFGDWPHKLVYGLADQRPDPLRVEVVPEGELL